MTHRHRMTHSDIMKSSKFELDDAVRFLQVHLGHEGHRPPRWKFRSLTLSPGSNLDDVILSDILSVWVMAYTV